jgi:hypothetical protein
MERSSRTVVKLYDLTGEFSQACPIMLDIRRNVSRSPGSSANSSPDPRTRIRKEKAWYHDRSLICSANEGQFSTLHGNSSARP